MVGIAHEERLVRVVRRVLEHLLACAAHRAVDADRLSGRRDELLRLGVRGVELARHALVERAGAADLELHLLGERLHFAGGTCVMPGRFSPSWTHPLSVECRRVEATVLPA